MARWPSAISVLTCKPAVSVMAKCEARLICVSGSVVPATVRHIPGEEI